MDTDTASAELMTDSLTVIASIRACSDCSRGPRAVDSAIGARHVVYW